jgi:hypothetical protein
MSSAVIEHLAGLQAATVESPLRVIRFDLASVLRHALTFFVKQAEAVHDVRVAFVSGLLVPLARSRCLCQRPSRTTRTPWRSPAPHQTRGVCQCRKAQIARQVRRSTPQEVTGKYLVVWEKVGSDWKLAADIWNDGK